MLLMPVQKMNLVILTQIRDLAAASAKTKIRVNFVHQANAKYPAKQSILQKSSVIKKYITSRVKDVEIIV